MKRGIITVVILMLSVFALKESNAKPSWKIPLEGGYYYMVTVGYGGVTYNGSLDVYHTDANNGYYALDFDNPAN